MGSPSELPEASVDASPHLAGVDGGATGWVTFHRRDDLRDVGPAWSFETSLPALSDDGARVLVPRTEAQGVGAVPSLSLAELRLSDGAVVGVTTILEAREVIEAALADGGRAEALRDLATRVERRVTLANERLARRAWTPLTECSSHDPPDSAQPACSMGEQRFACGALQIVRRGASLQLRLDQRTAVAPAPVGSVRSVPSPGGPPVAVKACFADVWLEPSRKVLVGLLRQECQGAGGDWCVAPSEWHVVPLPFAPSPGAKDAAPTDGGASCRPGMIAVPGGSFEMGSEKGLPNERPVHHEMVSPFCMDATEVTVHDYAACVGKHRCFAPGKEGSGDPFCSWGKPGSDRLPVNCVGWADADEYCRSVGKRLPTEVEWEYAAGGPEGRTFPWGEAAPPADVCWNRGNAAACPVGSSAGDRTPSGIADLAGDVSEWTAKHSTEVGEPPDAYAVRGAAFSSTDARDLRGAHRDAKPAGSRLDTLGFRCASP